jgi:hypothetical protein
VDDINLTKFWRIYSVLWKERFVTAICGMLQKMKNLSETVSESDSCHNENHNSMTVVITIIIDLVN